MNPLERAFDLLKAIMLQEQAGAEDSCSKGLAKYHQGRNPEAGDWSLHFEFIFFIFNSIYNTVDRYIAKIVQILMHLIVYYMKSFKFYAGYRHITNAQHFFEIRGFSRIGNFLCTCFYVHIKFDK